MVTLRPYQPASFLTPMGSWAKMRVLKRKGFPQNLRNWRFVTLTTDPARYPDEEEAYEIGKRRLRQFLYELRQDYDILKWWGKIEFHEPDELGRGFVHWHLLIDYKRPIAAADLRRAWPLGRVQIQGVRDSRFEYLFKYVAKGMDWIPDWVLRRKRMRFCFSSPGFFPADGKRGRKDGPSPRLGADPAGTNTENNRIADSDTIGERLKRWARSAISRSISGRGGLARYRRWELRRCEWSQLVVQAARLKISRSMTDEEMTVTGHQIETSETWIQILPVSYPTGRLSVA